MSIDARLDELVQDFSRFGQNVLFSFGAGSQLPQWFRPSGWEGDPFNIPGLTAGWDRDEIGARAQQAVTGGTVGELMSAQLQGEVLATAERAFRLRHCGQVRAAAHAAGRYFGCGSEGGVLQAGVLAYLTDLLKSGSKT